MRTTLTIDDDVLTAAKAMARQTDRSLGEVISDLARTALVRPRSFTERNGLLVLGPRPGTEPVTMELVNAMRDDLP
jgi:hypothetical protein